jgi:hypothetical protein
MTVCLIAAALSDVCLRPVTDLICTDKFQGPTPVHQVQTSPARNSPAGFVCLKRCRRLGTFLARNCLNNK